MKLYTSRFPYKTPSSLIRVSIAVGNPDWEPDIINCSVLAPYGIFGKDLSYQDYRDRYIAKLNNLNFPLLEQKLQRISDENQSRDIVLLCWENLQKDGEWCHRRMFADWWKENTGEEVPEFEEELRRMREEAIKRQGTLF